MRFMISSVVVAAAWLSSVCSAQTVLAPVLLNPGFEETTVRPATDPELARLKNIGWKFTEPIDWPRDWNPSEVSNVTFAISQEKPHSGKNCLLLWGESGSSGYLSTTARGLRKVTYKVSFYGRGKGKATLMTPGVHLVLNRPLTDAWVRYSGIFKNTAGVNETSVSLQAQGGQVWFDDLTIEECDALEEMRVREDARLTAKGALLAPGAPVDSTLFQTNLSEITQALPRLKSLVEADPIPANVAAVTLLATRIDALKQVVKPTVDEMNVSTCYASICERLLLELDFVEAEEGK